MPNRLFSRVVVIPPYMPFPNFLLSLHFPHISLNGIFKRIQNVDI